MRREVCLALKRCAKVKTGAQNTTKQAGNLPDSEVFSRPEYMVLDVGIAYPQGRRHNLFCVLNPHIHSECLKSARNGFQSRQGAETMTKVKTQTTPTAATLGNTPATTSNTKLGRVLHARIIQRRYPELRRSPVQTNLIARRQAIENALSMALHYIRTIDSQQGIQAATAKAIRAASLLKQACTESTIGGRA